MRQRWGSSVNLTNSLRLARLQLKLGYSFRFKTCSFAKSRVRKKTKPHSSNSNLCLLKATRYYSSSNLVKTKWQPSTQSCACRASRATSPRIKSRNWLVRDLAIPFGLLSTALQAAKSQSKKSIMRSILTTLRTMEFQKARRFICSKKALIWSH